MSKGGCVFVEETPQGRTQQTSGGGTWHLVKLGLQRWERFATDAKRNASGGQYSD